MGCTESRQTDTVQRIKVQESSILNKNNNYQQTNDDPTTRVSSGYSNVTIIEDDFLEEPNLVMTDEERFQRRISSANFSLNLSESLDSRMSLSFKSNTPSAASNVSVDSGMYELDDPEYSHVITEHSDPDKVRQVEDDFQPKEHLELYVMGREFTKRQSARSRQDIQDEQLVMASLRDEGLITRAPSKATSGLSFEVISVDALPEHNNTVVRKLPPIKLERMEQRRKKRKVTKETIQEKLEKAEERRKQQEEERVNKSSVRPKTAIIQQEVEKFQENTRHNYQKKLDATTENREKYIQDMREKLRAKREHSAKVRLRKMLNPIQSEVDAIPEEENV